MAGRWILLAGLLGALLAPAGAQAGTYDVVSCAAPGADGRNNSLTPFAESYDPQYAPQLGGWYEHDASCADGLIARASTATPGDADRGVADRRGLALHRARGHGDRRLRELALRRGARPGAATIPTTPTDDGDHWRVDVVDGDRADRRRRAGRRDVRRTAAASTPAPWERRAACARTTG